MAHIPTGILSDAKAESLSDDALYRAQRDFAHVASALATLAGQCEQRANALQSVIDRRAHARSVGKSTTPTASTGIAKGARFLQNGASTVTFGDHALMRYLERIRGIDLDATADEMRQMFERGEERLGGAVVVSGGHCFIRRPDGFVKTILPMEWLGSEEAALAERTYAQHDADPRTGITDNEVDSA